MLAAESRQSSFRESGASKYSDRDDMQQSPDESVECGVCDK